MGMDGERMPRTQAEDWYRRLDSAANTTQLEAAWKALQLSNARIDTHRAILCTSEGAETDRVAQVSFPDGTLIVAEPRRSKDSPWRSTKLRLKTPGWFSLVDAVGVFDRGMLPDVPESIHGLLDPDTLVQQEFWAELVLWWIDRFGVDRFPRGYRLTRDQVADLLHKAEKRHVRVLFQTLLSNAVSSDT